VAIEQNVGTRASTRSTHGSLLSGGTAGSELLTAATGAVLIALLAVIGVTIVSLTRLLWIHLVVGMLLIGPLALKLASAGYRFARYYTANPRSRCS
jgi:integral membrane sensor domain MASE1